MSGVVAGHLIGEGSSHPQEPSRPLDAEIRALVGLRVDVMPVVKAEAYGHGATDVARAAQEAGAEWFGVATVAEGVALRKCLPGGSICVFTPFEAHEAPEIVLHHLTPFVGDFESARALSQAAQEA